VEASDFEVSARPLGVGWSKECLVALAASTSGSYRGLELHHICGYLKGGNMESWNRFQIMS
jgi:hypothetical protein